MGATRPRRTRQRGAAFCAALLLAACADFGPAAGGAPTAREQRLQALEARLDQVTRKVEDLAAAPQTESLPRIEAEVRGLRGEVERLRHDFDTAEKRSDEQVQALERRLARLEGQGGTPLPAAPGPAGQDEEAAYTAVFEQLRARKYDESIAGFRSLLSRWPQGRYADNAWYWLGEAHYAKKEVVPALDAFRALLARFPDSPKAPDALFKAGVCLADQQKPAEARASWEKVIAQWPDSPAAGRARERLRPPK